MRLLAQNLLVCNQKNCKGQNSSLVLRIDTLIENQAVFNKYLTLKMIEKLDWSRFCNTALELGHIIPDNTQNLDLSLPEYENILRLIHSLLFRLEITQGALICQNCSKLYRISNGIANMILDESWTNNQMGCRNCKCLRQELVVTPNSSIQNQIDTKYNQPIKTVVSTQGTFMGSPRSETQILKTGMGRFSYSPTNKSVKQLLNQADTYLKTHQNRVPDSLMDTSALGRPRMSLIQMSHTGSLESFFIELPEPSSFQIFQKQKQRRPFSCQRRRQSNNLSPAQFSQTRNLKIEKKEITSKKRPVKIRPQSQLGARPISNQRKKGVQTKNLNVSEQKIRNEFLMSNNHYLLHTLKKQGIEKERKFKNYQASILQRFSQYSKAFLSIRKNLPSKISVQIPSSRKPKKILEGRTKHRKISEGTQKIWLDKRGKTEETNQKLSNFAVAIFDLLDQKHLGYIPGKSLLESFLSLGIVSDPRLLEKTLLLILKKQELQTSKISQTEFQALFKSDQKTDLLLRVLNNQTVMRRKATGHSLKPVISISQHQQLVNLWWKKINPKKLPAVNLNKIACKFVDLQVVKDPNEGANWVYSILGPKPMLSYDNFQQLFSKSMLKGALHSLYYRLNHGQFASQQMSPSYTVGCYRRALILSGIRCPNSDIPIQEGQAALSAMQEFSNTHQAPSQKLTELQIKKRVLNLPGFSIKQAEQRSIYIRENRKKQLLRTHSVTTGSLSSTPGEVSSCPSPDLFKKPHYFQPTTQIIQQFSQDSLKESSSIAEIEEGDIKFSFKSIKPKVRKSIKPQRSQSTSMTENQQGKSISLSRPASQEPTIILEKLIPTLVSEALDYQKGLEAFV